MLLFLLLARGHIAACFSCLEICTCFNRESFCHLHTSPYFIDPSLFIEMIPKYLEIPEVVAGQTMYSSRIR